MRASLRVMARPSPVPPKFCAVVASAWLNSSNSFARCSGVMPMPVSETANSTKLLPLLTLRAASLTSPALVNLQALLRRLISIWRRRIGATVNAPRFVCGVNDEGVLVLLGKLSRSADDLVDEPGQINGFGIEFELTGFDLRGAARPRPHHLPPRLW